jgi:omega-amidase
MNSLAVTTIQTHLHWHDPVANRLILAEKIAQAPPASLVVLPEMFTTGFSMAAANYAEPMDGPTLAWMRERAATHRLALCGSLMVAEGGCYFNRFVFVLPNGHVGCYDKRHLFALAGEHQVYTAGHKKLLASLDGWKINPQICYDLRFPVWSRQTATVANGAAPYDVLVYVANWPEPRRQAWRLLLQARAIENQCYVVGVNRIGQDGNGHHYTGDSLVIDPLGAILHDAGSSEGVATTLLSAHQLQTVRTKLPFWADADRFELHT